MTIRTPDLDFNYIGALDREAMLRARPDVERAVESIAREQKYAIQRSRDEIAGRKLFLNYVTVNGSPDRSHWKTHAPMAILSKSSSRAN